MDQENALTAGSTLGEFEIEKELGKGGMGIVYKAHEPSLNRKVALKVLSRMLSNDAEFITRFKKEAQIIASLNHPNIVKILTFGQDLGQYYFAMEYIQGKDLHKILKEKIKIPVSEALLIARQVADALSEANQRGVVHRDLKPANIMIDKMNRVKVTDFGVARVEGSNDNLTRTGAFLGSPQYASPEQATGQPIDTRSDIYSLGAVLYRMLSGTPPTTGDSPLAVMIKVATDTVTPIDQVNPSVPEPVCKLIDKMMAKDPAKRFQTPQEVMNAIDECGKILQQEKTIVNGETVVFPQQEETPSAGSKHGKMYAASIVGAVCLLLVLIFFFVSPTNKEVVKQEPVSSKMKSEQTLTSTENPSTTTKQEEESPQPLSSDKQTDSSTTPSETLTLGEDKEIKALVPSETTTPGDNDNSTTTAITTSETTTSDQDEKIAAVIPSEKVIPGYDTKVSQDKSIIPASIEPQKAVALPKKPTVLLLVTGIESMTPFLYTHLEANMIDSGLHVVSPIDIPVLSEKTQYGTLPLNWYDIKHLLPDRLAQVLVLAKIQKAGSTILKYDGYSQEQITAIFSVRTLDMTTGASVQRSLAGTVKCTALNIDEEMKDTISKTVNDLGPSIQKYWQKKLKDTASPVPAVQKTTGQKISDDQQPPNTPSVLLIVTGPEDTNVLFRSNLESNLLDNGLRLMSPEEFPMLRKKMQIGDLPVNIYDIKQFLPDHSADVLVLASIQKAGSTPLKYGDRDQELITANYSIRTLDLTNGLSVKPSSTGVIKYTALNMDDAFKNNLTNPLNNLGKSIKKYWREKTNEDEKLPLNSSDKL